MESVKVDDHMNHRPIFFKGDEPVAAAVERLLQSGSSGGPVVNVNREVVGFVSEHDCMKAMLSSTYHSGEVTKLVEDIMSTDTVCVKAYDSILRVAEDMSGQRPRVYPVVDDDGKLVGAINRKDVLNALDKHLHAIFEANAHFV